MLYDVLPSDIFITYFSAYSAHMVEYKGEVYPTVEHAYHCQRYDDENIRNQILCAKSPYQAWQISQKYKGQQRKDFNNQKVKVMESLCRAKFTQHEDVRQALKDSGNSKIVKHITTGPEADGFWDDGEDGKGWNEAGKIWMRIREEY